MKKKATYLLFFLVTPFYLLAQVPAYYSQVDFTVSPQQIQQQLTNLITTTHDYELNYTPEVWDILKIADLEPNQVEDVLLLYGYEDFDGISKNDRSRNKDLNCTSSSCVGLWNREHVFPRSLATPPLETNYPNAGTVAHGLRACDSQMNSSRNNRPYEQGTGNAEITPDSNFYPGDEWKGDVARIIMYLYLRYPSQCEAVTVGIGSTNYSNLGDMPDIFLEWNTEDPVSSLETQRNTVIFDVQGNRNPFVDNPYFATILWNGPEAEQTWDVLEVSDIAIETPVLYPTITNGLVYVKNVSQTVFEYRVYSVSGKFVLAGTTTHKIDLANLSKGMYFVQMQNETVIQTEKIIMR
ncbi:MAG: hypothetical protein COZ75_08055 [Flavobacteriaceae bacterium CG_4_8_14_3_um_filter_34_10]|nr:MAG: hypothetical protein COS19_08655 [Flavobacteriaceae bacterium CG02_land_8_20_14_3_00_34_13]PIX09205.1 MAG: hypothetical protein COZ75_08055 [Flavobacteriaceae bacterium CG_4_8_14_3_um_filter_34_10]PJC08350.1 MAG: hypothetical protein CO068_01255 [Flavobacteriaceae bacterium CG_4_9_14_0_8_um_filter_34_30]